MNEPGGDRSSTFDVSTVMVGARGRLPGSGVSAMEPVDTHEEQLCGFELSDRKTADC